MPDVQNLSSCSPGSIKSQQWSNHQIRGRRAERLEHDLRRPLPLLFGIERRFRQQDWMLFWSNSQLVVERVMPDPFHVLPVSDESVFDGVLQGQQVTSRLCLVSDIRYFSLALCHDREEDQRDMKPQRGSLTCFRCPTREGKTDRGTSSPAKPAFNVPAPLSITMAVITSAYILRSRR